MVEMKKLILIPLMILLLLGIVFADYPLDEYTTINSANAGGFRQCGTATGGGNEFIMQPFNMSTALSAGDNITIEVYGHASTASLDSSDRIEVNIVNVSGDGTPKDSIILSQRNYTGDWIPDATDWWGKNMSLKLFFDVPQTTADGGWVAFSISIADAGGDIADDLLYTNEDMASTYYGVSAYNVMYLDSGDCNPITATAGEHAGDTLVFRINAVPATVPPNTTGLPSFVNPTPSDNSVNTTNQTINMSIADNVNFLYTLWFDTNADPTTLVIDNATNSNWTMNVGADGTYYYKAAVYNISTGVASANTSVRTFTLDTTNPVLTINPNNFFNSSDNMSTMAQYLNNITLNVSATDNDNIFAFLYNITKDGVIYYNHTNESINEESYNFTRILDITSWPDGVYDIEVSVADGHHYTGGYKIGKYEIVQVADKITFDTTEGNQIIISSDGAYTTTYTKEVNSYSIGFKYNIKSTTRTYYIESKDGKVYYLPDSKYKAHFVIWNGKHGNWFDLEGLKGDYTVKKINDYKYQIIFTNLPLTKEVITKSIGGLNVVTQNYKWYRGTYDDSAPQTFSRLTTDLILNITKNDEFISNISVTVKYNNTDETTSKRDYGSYIIYNVTVTAPDVKSDTDIPYSWNITINQSNNGIYNFTVAGSNSVLNWGLDTCINATVPTLNITFKNLSNDEYVNVNLEYVFEFWLPPSTILYNFSGNLTGNNQTFCKYSNETGISANILFEYNVVGISTLFDYFLFEINLTNVTRQLTLYTQGGTTQVLFTTLDIDSNPIENAYIHILQFDIATNTYQTTEILKTDSQGQALGNIILGTTFYNFFVYYQGSLVYTEHAVKVIETTRTFTINLAGADWFDDFETTLGVTTNLYFNNATNNFVYIWSDPTSAMHFACLKIEETNRTGKFELNTTCVESTSGTILYNIPVLNAGSTYMGTGYLKFDFPMITDVVNFIVSPSSSFFRISPLMGLFIALLFCVSMVMIGLPIPSLSLTFLGIGVLITSLLGLWAISIMQVVSIIFLMIIQLYMRKSRQ